ncbi:mitochondrial large ribosomal subunit L49, putative [Talaromyces stipitatus ATCC 10500]|uniref:Large ribosomal subunit protein mL49 n=1 Tax=Talaromyces stipitatus (strain ATCC 10500 / CBS 375.48 / QM 6759 / NRRL 1006) TaxID=441959 RepID=B8M4Z3_TALSN|nr:mitochondrial large ribosomal subunit L49, putative [Talaromyces stipitatus ATCC 10500]EED19428.1 mitochondrial large ribosomal subunit L49, putative [Talaromyces stipitatus ATCC 10500]
MASITRSLTTMSTVRHQLSTVNSTRQFSILHNHTQRLLSRNGIANQLSHNPTSSRSLLPVQQYRTFLAKLARRFPASTQFTRPPISPVETEAPSSTQAQTAPLQLTNLPYFVRRTPSNKLPVYLETKAGGTKRLTKIQKTEGDLEALKSDLAKALNLETGSKKPEITINSTTGHIIVKGWRKDEIQKFLIERNF